MIVLAAYRPDPELFRLQLSSIRDQTRTDFRCLIGADGGADDIRRLVLEIVGDDPRFEVLGWDDNRGFYLNFERLLEAVPPEVTWVALSDQDDRWYPTKLETLVPHLDTHDLVTAQARVVAWPSDRVLRATTGRRVVPTRDLLFENQVTGSLSVIRTSLLTAALPFPRLNTVTQLHDHWLAMCAATHGGWTVVDLVVQDYVQHGKNLVGEVSAVNPPWTPSRSLRRWAALADQYEGGHSPTSMLRVGRTLSFGWRKLMLDALTVRTGLTTDVIGPPAAAIQRARHLDDLRVILYGLRSPNIAAGVVATFVAGLPGSFLRSRRASTTTPPGAGTVRFGEPR
ncbi:hypothetical protein ASD62_16495 [Phycicoccus sp. Root563]|uniref:glycosyltransferase n=1 Tax=Phycicoccus sp. Root563 TaxID=1736562 RepID=UPI00070341BB|nr:glycosyltransferase [Phycicoccus sp. Root563]KQZ90648.1 hypothetical protein ASD62_16495 [Phycicoccus sp. Root563]